jgi:hypothetical protein
MAIRASARKLPSAAEVRAAGLGIERAWRSLLRRLEPIAGGEALVVPGGGIGLQPEPRLGETAEAVRLMTLLIRPDEDFLAALLSRCGASEAYAKRAGRLPENVGKFANPSRFATIKSFVRSEAFIRFTSTYPKPGLEDCFDGVMASCPGLTWYAGAAVRCFSEHWSTVWMSNDPEETEEDAFPVFLGFARRDGGWRAAGRVLSACEPVFGGFPDEVMGDPLLAVCGVSDDSGSRHADALIALTDDQLAAVDRWLGPYWGFSRPGLQRASDALSFLSNHAESIGDGPRAVSALFDLIGDPTRFADLERLEHELLEDPTFLRLSERTTERRRNAAIRALVRRIARGDSSRLWSQAHREEPLPTGDPLFSLLCGWHPMEKDPLGEPWPPDQRMSVDQASLGGVRPARARNAAPTTAELQFLQWALKGKGKALLEWLRSDPRPEAAGVLEAIVETSREPFAFERPTYGRRWWLSEERQRNLMLSDLKAAVEAFENRDSGLSLARDPGPARSAD